MWGNWIVLGILGAVSVVSVFAVGFQVGRETGPKRPAGKHVADTVTERRRVILDQASGARKVTRVNPASLLAGSSGGTTATPRRTRLTSLSSTATQPVRPYAHSAGR